MEYECLQPGLEFSMQKKKQTSSFFEELMEILDLIINNKPS